ncbi:hypothetical protein HY624_03075 [Candidatus Uhrbacteria bacterium]|nr:hypothetical protein [Candidatus Uhrbacteria bacterium]
MTGGAKLALCFVVGFLASMAMAAGQDTLALSMFVSLAVVVALNRKSAPIPVIKVVFKTQWMQE